MRARKLARRARARDTCVIRSGCATTCSGSALRAHDPIPVVAASFVRGCGFPTNIQQASLQADVGFMDYQHKRTVSCAIQQI